MTKKTTRSAAPSQTDPTYTFDGYIDLDEEEINEPDGTRLTEARAQEIVEEVRRGRPGLGHRRGGRGKSPQITVRVTETTRAAAERRAKAEGRTVSDLAREALERYLSA
jgi:hypothetical protein